MLQGQHDYSNVEERAVLACNQMELGKVLGTGNFGKVYEATVHLLSGEIITATVKQPNPEAHADFSDEVDILSKVSRLGGHRNIVGMVGFVREDQNQGTPLLALEHCALGDLQSYLRQQGALTTEVLMPMCLDVASGMKFLEESLIAHRDLAARTVLLTAELLCKIADFGLSRNTAGRDYYRRTIPRRSPSGGWRLKR